MKPARGMPIFLPTEPGYVLGTNRKGSGANLQGASFSQGVRLILRHVTVTFSTSQTPFVLQDQSAKERKNA